MIATDRRAHEDKEASQGAPRNSHTARNHEIWLEPGAQRGEEEGGDVVAKALVAHLLPGSILRSKLCLKLGPPAVESLDVLALLLEVFESRV